MWRPRVLLPAASPPARHGAGVDRVYQFLLCIVFIGVIYRYCWIGKLPIRNGIRSSTFLSTSIDASDRYKCGALLHKGTWLGSGSSQEPSSSLQNWQPPGCTMHEYKQTDISQCLQGRRLVFIGDSTVRQVFWAVAQKNG
jgi:hypothetical protein